MAIQFHTEVRTDSDYDEIPEAVTFEIDVATAREIARLAIWVKTNQVYKIEKFDARARYYRYDPASNSDQAIAAGEENDVRTDADCLNVSENDFWFSAYIKHTDVEILSERKRIWELLEHLDITIESSPVTGQDKAQAFVDQVARLSLWDHDRDDGTPYRECEEPDDGYGDSHECLMALIEQARALQTEAAK